MGASAAGLRNAAVLLPAAGASTRMRGRDKLLEPVAGRPLLRRQAERALATGAAVAVTLRPEDHARRAALDGLSVAVLAVPDAALGMSASLRRGARWASDRGAVALVVVLPDMPEITSADIRTVFQAWARVSELSLRATTASGIPGHPVVIPNAVFPALANLAGDRGASSLLRNARHCPLAGVRAITDLDTPEDWDAWRARPDPP